LFLTVLLLALPSVGEAGQITENEVRDALLAYVGDQGPAGVDVERWELRKGDPLPVQGRILGVEMAPGARWGETTPVRMRIESNTGESQTLWITSYLRRACPVVVACRTLPIGHLIETQDVRVETREGWRSREGLYEGLGEVVGRRVQRPVSKGACVKSWHIGEQEGAKRGNAVVILAQTGSVRVQAPGRLLQSGNPGDRVKVLNTASGKEIYATLLDAKTVSASF
jgi:flagella basal body P-ring formation protein FlgA